MAVLPCSIAFNLLIDELDPAKVDIDACYPSPEVMEAWVRETFEPLDPSGKMGEECCSEYASKLEGWYGARPAFQSFLAGWPVDRSRLRELVPPADLNGCGSCAADATATQAPSHAVRIRSKRSI